MAQLRIVLTILSTNQLFAKMYKYKFGVTEVEYLGHIIFEKGVAIYTSKIQAVLEWPVPTTHRGVHGFLGLAGYYQKFIQHFDGITAPLHRFLIKDGFQWTEEAKLSFQRLK